MLRALLLALALGTAALGGCGSTTADADKKAQGPADRKAGSEPKKSAAAWKAELLDKDPARRLAAVRAVAAYGPEAAELAPLLRKQAVAAGEEGEAALAALEKIDPLTARQAESMRKLQRLVRAMHAYHEKFKGFPPARKGGTEWEGGLSWRVEILPFLGPKEKALYAEFRFEEPWDSPHNRKLLDKMPDVYAPPWLPGLRHDPGTTFYQGIVGGAFPGKQIPLGVRGKIDPALKGHWELVPENRPWRMTRIYDGTANTFLIVEARAAVPWTKPEDLRYPETIPPAGVLPKDPPPPLPPLGGLFKDGFAVAFADGTVRFVRRNVGDDILRAAITPDRGEPLNWFDRDEPELGRPDLPEPKGKQP